MDCADQYDQNSICVRGILIRQESISLSRVSAAGALTDDSADKIGRLRATGGKHQYAVSRGKTWRQLFAGIVTNLDGAMRKWTYDLDGIPW
jgi:hypothetical protein